MARFSKKFSPIHAFGTLFLFIGAGLLLATTISAPVIGDLAMLKVILTNFTDIRNSSVTFGTFGHCILDVPPVATDQDFCFPNKSVGYSPMKIMQTIDNVTYPSMSTDVADRLTHVMVLHPIAFAFAFIAFLCALGTGLTSAMISAFVALFAWLLTVIVVISDFVAFGIVKKYVNEDGSGSSAEYGVSIWTLFAAMVALSWGVPFIFMSSCGARRHRYRGVSNKEIT